VERELLLTGVGGQGVQLAAQVIARAATLEGRHVLLFGVYSGMMRGGNSDSTVVISDDPVISPPIVSSAWSALALHSEFWAPLAPRIRDGGTVVVNSSVFDGPLDRQRWNVVDVAATDIATELGNPQGVSMVAAGAYAHVTGVVGLDALIAGMHDALPPYRAQHAPANEVALRAGWDAAGSDRAA
jgi:2-oxoglutarate ferredoxin oxidoreductase subunit gamma